jgi:hypothetical protein
MTDGAEGLLYCHNSSKPTAHKYPQALAQQQIIRVLYQIMKPYSYLEMRERRTGRLTNIINI